MMGASKVVTSTAAGGGSSTGEAKGKPPSAPARATRSTAGMVPGKAFDMPNVLVGVPAALPGIGNSSGGGGGGGGKAKGRPSRAAALLAESRPGSLSSAADGAAGSPMASTANPRKRIFPNPENALVGGTASAAAAPKSLKTLPIAPVQARLQPRPSSGNYSIASLVTDRKEQQQLLDRDGAGKAEKGLRHFSAKVCAKVEEKGSTSYNEVADELVQEMGLELGTDNKNIRRRVYDALNVLMAIDVIEKDRKEIRWLGLSNDTTNEVSALESELAKTLRRVEEKQRCLKDLIQRKIALHGLIERNSRSENSINGQIVSSSSLLSEAGAAADGKADRLHLPFILVNAPRDCRVHCEMLEDRTQYFFEFDMPFFINEDIELLRLMGLDSATPEEMRAILAPELLAFYQSHLRAPDSAAGAAPAALLATSMAAPRVASHPGRRASGAAGRPTSTMSSPVFSRRHPDTAVPPQPSALRQSTVADPQPIGYTGIFRRTNSSHALPQEGAAPPHPAAAAADDVVVVSMPHFLSDPFKGE